MAAESTNKYHVYEWIKKVIDSCITCFHFKSVNNLISNFHNKYNDWQLTGKLRGYANNKQIKNIKMKKDYTRAILWGTIGVITIILWSIILSLI